MTSHTEISEFLSQFNTNSYNREQIGNNKQLIIKLYEYITKLNIDEDNTEVIINNIAYLKKDSINLPIFLELFSKSLSYLDSYNISELPNVNNRIRLVRLLNKLENNDIVELTDHSKKKVTYKVYAKYEIKQDDFSCLEQETNGNIELTLITCIKYQKSKRLVIKCVAV